MRVGGNKDYCTSLTDGWTNRGYCRGIWKCFGYLWGIFIFFRQKGKLALLLREGCKKRRVEFSTKVGGWGQQWTDSPLILYFLEKKYEFNPLKLPKIHFKTNFLFQLLVGGPSSARILDRREYWTSKLSGGAILQLSDDPYHTEFVSWDIEHFCFCFFFH